MSRSTIVEGTRLPIRGILPGGSPDSAVDPCFGPCTWHDVVAESAAMRRVVELLRRVAASPASTVLLTGESGVGKGLLARALHLASAGRERPFVQVTCTALPDALFESELFGHERGAFTDAKASKSGLFELAEGGTIFLDEIGSLSLSLQSKLLRFLEDRTLRHTGGLRDLRIDARVVAATNLVLEDEVAAGRFRRDLYYRLHVVPVAVPPLRQRVADILPLTRLFVRQLGLQTGRTMLGVDAGASQRLLRHGWPGNVRELRNVVERAVILGDGPLLGVDDLPEELRLPAPGPAGAEPAVEFALPAGGCSLEELERSLIRQALERTHGNQSEAARLVGLSRDQVRYRLVKYGLQSPELPPLVPLSRNRGRA